MSRIGVSGVATMAMTLRPLGKFNLEKPSKFAKLPNKALAKSSRYTVVQPPSPK